MRRLPIRPSIMLLAACLLAPAGATSAAAHQLEHVDPSSTPIDLGTADPARLIHTTLVKPVDTLVVKLITSSEPTELIMYVPDAKPERTREAADLPSITATWDGGGMVSSQDAATDPITDAATAISYLELARTPITAPAGTAVTVTVTRGAKPSRVALRVGPRSPFGAEDYERTPRTLTEVRIWNATPPPGTPRPASRAVDPNRAVAWFGAGVALVGVLVAIWWIRSGKIASRRRGVERAKDPRDPPR